MTSIFEVSGGFSAKQVAELDSLSRDWAFLTNQPIADAATEIAMAYWSTPGSRRRLRTIERLGADPFAGTPDELIDDLRERVGGAAPAWYGNSLSPLDHAVKALADDLARPLTWLANKISRN